MSDKPPATSGSTASFGSDAPPENAESVTGSIPIRHGPYPEFTWVAVLVGWAIGALIAVSILPERLLSNRDDLNFICRHHCSRCGKDCQSACSPSEIAGSKTTLPIVFANHLFRFYI